MTLSEHLRVPYLLEATSVEVSPGQWVRRLTYPELEGCVAESPNLEDAMRELETRRLNIILTRFDSGEPLPVPRAPLATGYSAWIALEAALPSEIVARIRREETMQHQSAGATPDEAPGGRHALPA